MNDPLRGVETEDQLRACYPVMKELRPHLESEDEFVARATRMAAQGYRILAAWDDGEVVALAGYRLQENLVYGRFLYVDDLIAGEQTRSQRWGARLLQQLTGYAERTGCAKLAARAMMRAMARRRRRRTGRPRWPCRTA